MAEDVFFKPSLWKWGDSHWVGLGSLGCSMRLTGVNTWFFIWPPLAPLWRMPQWCARLLGIRMSQDPAFTDTQWVMVFPVRQWEVILISSFMSLWERLRIFYSQYLTVMLEGGLRAFFHLKGSGLFRGLRVWRLDENSVSFHLDGLNKASFPLSVIHIK